jgi:GDPmannose 4,6-dehydratase
MKKKIALITGITGQDGSYLAELLISKNYVVHGIIRRSSSFNTERINKIYQAPTVKNKSLHLHYGDLSDATSITYLIRKIMPDEIYNLAAQSHVGVSFQIPVYTADINALGCLRILEVVRSLKKIKKIKFYQASTSELYGKIQEKKQSEKTRFYPLSPYATSKLFAYWTTKNYREAYNIFACNGILFNHESPRRGGTFVTKKITASLSNIYFGLEKIMLIGNLKSKRDWGHAQDYAYMQWKMLQVSKPDDFVISNDFSMTVKEFINRSANVLGFSIEWKGKNFNEKGYIKSIFKKINNECQLKPGQLIAKVDKKYFRPLDVNELRGDSSKAKKILKWKPKIKIESLIKEMVHHDFSLARNSYLIKNFNEKKE